MKITDHKELLIVGAGPAGLVLNSALLPEIPVTHISVKSQGLSPHSRATGIQPRVSSILDSLGILERVKEAAITLTGNTIYVDGEKKYSVSFYDPVTKSHELSIDQRALEELIELHLSERNRQIEWESKLIALECENGEITADVLTPKGQERWSCDYVVGCDGGRSIVRSCSGISFPGETYPENSFVLDGIVHGDLDRTSMHYFISKESRLVLVPIGRENLFKVSGAFPSHTTPTLSDLAMIVANHSKGAFTIEPMTPIHTYQMHARMVTSLSQSDRIFLCGDAAHLFPPNGGQGMNVAIEDAHVLAQLFNKIAMHYSSLASARSCQNNPLQNYETRLSELTARLASVKAAKEKYSYNSLTSEFNVSEEQSRIEKDEL
jgi:2-polyprenyl-6-methoxyphenol hydroxylase-like FAD-dependent oxidoreductase